MDNGKEKRLKAISGRLIIAALYFIPFIIVINLLDISLPENLVEPCLLRELTGLYCPGCGGTRALRNMLHGNVIISIIWHPVVIYMFYLAWLYTVSYLVKKVSGGRIENVRVRAWHFFVLVGLLILNFIVKNILLAGFGISTELIVGKLLVLDYNI